MVAFYKILNGVVIMKRILKLGLIALVLSLSFAGCRTASIQNVPEQSVVTLSTKKNISNDDVFKAILRAGVGLGWNVHKIEEGVAEATLHLRTHKAVVTIKYDTNTYTISYKESSNLKYDREKQTIHQNYNGWITNLNQAIQSQLTLL
ncbi:MAG: hypothetical protein L3J19_00575 [Sulfurimonas sp.]|nr:hypothetical protein [Sulfurimonas sp.]